MRRHHNGFAFDLLDEWWDEAGMDSFSPGASSYRVRADGCAFPIIEVAISDVEPLRDTTRSHGVFSDSPTEGEAQELKKL